MLPLDGYESLDEETLADLPLPTLIERYRVLQAGLQESDGMEGTLNERRQGAEQECRRLRNQIENLNQSTLREYQRGQREHRAGLTADAAARRVRTRQQECGAESAPSLDPGIPSTGIVPPPPPNLAALIRGHAATD